VGVNWRLALVVALIILGAVVALRACRHSVAGVPPLLLVAADQVIE